MKLNLEEIKAWPLTTNKIEVEYDRDKMFYQYSIVSYYSLDKEYKNLAYEQLADIPFISVCGIRAKWNDVQYPCARFFIMMKKEELQDVMKSLRAYEQIRSRIDDLTDYDYKLQQRIIASLAINSLGKTKPDRMMYNNGVLLLCDDKNFLIPHSRKELVCLKVEVNEYMNLTAKTTSFSNPKSIDELRKKQTCVFQVSKDIYGQWWSGLAVKPVVIRKMKGNKLELESLYVQKKRFPDKHNIVPYWPYNPDDYSHGRLFAISQVIDSVNEKYQGILSIRFVDSDVLYYDEYKPSNDMLNFIAEYLNGKSVYIENPFGKLANDLISQMIDRFQGIMQGTLVFHKKRTSGDLIIKLCEPTEEQLPQTHYTKSLYRLADSSIVLQHKIFYNNDKEDKFSISEARRILIELLVKDCLIKRKISQQLCALSKDWEFYKYKNHEEGVIGASMKFEEDGKIEISEFGFSAEHLPVFFDEFAYKYLNYMEPEKIKGARDYLALRKNGNVYLIIDTDEIPILDVGLIDEAYDGIVNANMPLSLFKRKNVAHKYLRGYIGLHLWKTDGLNGEPNGAYAYISGTNSENMQIMKSTKMDRMPRARRIFILHKENESEVEKEIYEIMDMLRYGFGRWNEMMTYPFPFKFLQEYLDDTCEIAFSKHWSEI